MWYIITTYSSNNIVKCDPFENLEEGLNRYSNLGDIILSGDFNARTGILSEKI